MKVYYRINVLSAENFLKFADKINGNINNQYFTLTGIDFGDGLINMRNQAQYDLNKERIEDFIKTENENIVQRLLYQNIMEHCELDNIVEVDTDNESIHIGYIEEFDF